MKISIRGKIFLAFGLFISLSALIWALSYRSQNILNQKIQIIEKKYDLLNTILEARRYEKNFFLSYDEKNISESLGYINQAERLLHDIIKNTAPALPGNSDQTVSELVTYRESLKNILKLQTNGFTGISPKTIEKVREQGRSLTSELENVVEKESRFVQDLIGKSKTIHLVALIPVFLLSVLIALFLIFSVDRPLKTIEDAIAKIAKGDFKNIPEIKTGDEFESLVTSLNNMISELRKRSKQLARAQKMASLGKFTSGVAHELNNPLNNISTSIQILIEEIEENNLEFQKELLAGAELQVERGKEIVRSLLEFSRETRLSLEKVNFKDLAANAIRQVQSQLPDNIHIRLNVPHNIQASLGVERIERVLTNLIVNAVHAMENGGQITIIAKNEYAKNGFSFQVTDTGRGIAENIIAKVFDPFFTTKDPGKGSGLGLSIVYGIIKQHKGHISVSSRIGEGTTFTCFLPFHPSGQRDS